MYYLHQGYKNIATRACHNAFKKSFRIICFTVAVIICKSLYAEETSGDIFNYSKINLNLIKTNIYDLNVKNNIQLSKSRYIINSETYPFYKKAKNYRRLSVFCRVLSVIPWTLSSGVLWITLERFRNERIVPTFTTFFSPLGANALSTYYSTQKIKNLSYITPDKSIYIKKYTRGLIITQSISAGLWAGSTLVLLSGRYNNEFGLRVYSGPALISALGYIMALNLNIMGIRFAISKQYFKDKKPKGSVFFSGSKKGIIAGYRMSF